MVRRAMTRREVVFGLNRHSAVPNAIVKCRIIATNCGGRHNSSRVGH